MTGFASIFERFRREGQIWLSRLGNLFLSLVNLYRLRTKRRRFLARAILKRRELKIALDQTHLIQCKSILSFSTIRNEIDRLPHFLKHYRLLGVDHFLIVANNCTDGSVEYLKEQPDVSIWVTDRSYKASRFGVDWLTWLQIRFGHKHWTLTVDADELLIYPHYEHRPLAALTQWLDRSGQTSLQAMMLDMYPKGEIGTQQECDLNNPLKTLRWFDSGNYSFQIQQPMKNLWIQGGPRARQFFESDPQRSPTLNKIPLVKWNRRFAYVNSTHSALPRRLNQSYGVNGDERISGVLLHTKFLDSIVKKSQEEKLRKEHFNNSELYNDYYDALIKNPDLWTHTSVEFQDWKQLERLGLISSGGWA